MVTPSFSWLPMAQQLLAGQVGLLVFLMFVGVFYGLLMGRDRALFFLLLQYPALAAVVTLPALHDLAPLVGLQGKPFYAVGLFLALFCLTVVCVWRSPFGESLWFGRGSWWESILSGLAQVGFACTVTLYLLPPAIRATFPSQLEPAFAFPWMHVIWTLLPLILYGVLGKTPFHRDHGEYSVDDE